MGAKIERLAAKTVFDPPTYSQTIKVTGAETILFISGQIPFDPQTGIMIEGDISAQTRQVLQNIGALLKSGGLSYGHVVRTTVFLANMDDFAAMNDVYRTFFEEPYPARSTVQAARLPRDARIEIDVIAMA